jgi:CRISPR-associated protein Cas5t
VGYVFLSTTVGVDLETIYELAAPLKAKTNVIKRQFLFEPNLYLYFDNDKIVEAFSRPHYPMLLGRSTELAMVEEITTIEVIPKERQKLGGTVVPFPTVGVHGPLQALPTYMTDDIPRKAMGTKPFHILKDFIIYEAELPTDAEKQWAVWMHGE